MKTIYSERHRLQDGKAELIDGKLLPCFEKPARAELIIARVREVGLGEVLAPAEHGLDPLRRVHTEPFLRFLESAWSAWVAEHGAYDALPLCWPTRGLRQVEPEAIDGKLSYFSFDAGTPITAGTWQAACSAADVALTGADLIAAGAERAVFALCRPPGHHAASDCYGGYCFLNNGKEGCTPQNARTWRRRSGARGTQGGTENGSGKQNGRTEARPPPVRRDRDSRGAQTASETSLQAVTKPCTKASLGRRSPDWASQNSMASELSTVSSPWRMP
jgi:hypothetical protein